jgi:hypothetical protein
LRSLCKAKVMATSVKEHDLEPLHVELFVRVLIDEQNGQTIFCCGKDSTQKIEVRIGYDLVGTDSHSSACRLELPL